MREDAAPAPQVTQKQRTAADREAGLWSIDRIVDRADDKAGVRQYRARYAGYADPKEDRWYDEDDLRAMGAGTKKLLDKFDAAADLKERLKSTMGKKNAPGVRRSARLAANLGAQEPGQKSFVTVCAETREDDKSEEANVKVDSEVCLRTDLEK